MAEFTGAGIERLETDAARMDMWIESGKRRKREDYRVTLRGKDGGLEVEFSRPARSVRDRLSPHYDPSTDAVTHTAHALPKGELCECEDFEYRRREDGGRCKHLLALAHLGLIGDPPRPRRVLRDLGPPETVRQEMAT